MHGERKSTSVLYIMLYSSSNHYSTKHLKITPGIFCLFPNFFSFSPAWGFGFLFVTVISVGSLLGAVVVPIMHKKIFQTVLMSMISLAVGVLSGSGIFHLIPHVSFVFMSTDKYLTKSVFGILL